MNNSCPYCHNYKRTKNNSNYGKAINEHIEWFDWIRKTKVRKQVLTSILSPENKRPRLRSNVFFRDNPETMFEIEINYCPICGRKLGGEADENVQ